MLERNALLIKSDYIEVRIRVGLPADLRSILGEHAIEIFFTELPLIVSRALDYNNISATEIARHVDSVEDQIFLRGWLKQERLVAFIADGSILPRHSGIDDRPLPSGALAFRSPQSRRVTPVLPNAGSVEGMGIPEGGDIGGGWWLSWKVHPAARH